ncbi:hypothetical protein AB0A74_38950 [Saccharothrix sp. NPDC042600]|uniref:hypothetical protein n=1 Tax=Saccharothrix TaxID=2071 RepID=UPI0033F114DF
MSTARHPESPLGTGRAARSEQQVARCVGVVAGVELDRRVLAAGSAGAVRRLELVAADVAVVVPVVQVVGGVDELGDDLRELGGARGADPGGAELLDADAVADPACAARWSQNSVIASRWRLALSGEAASAALTRALNASTPSRVMYPLWLMSLIENTRSNFCSGNEVVI